MFAFENDLRRAAQHIFADTLASMDAHKAVRRAVSLQQDQLIIADTDFDLHQRQVYSIAIGKAAEAMASALDEILGERLASGIISAPPLRAALSARWRVFAGGHPLPNGASIEAARASFDLLQHADDQKALIVFLISGGGSAMIEWPRLEQTTLADLQAANRVLVSCGASIAEINAVRRAFSSIKGGGLSARAPRAAQVTLIISDTAANEESNVASGPTLAPSPNSPDALAVVRRYQLSSRLPDPILQSLNQPLTMQSVVTSNALHRHIVLLDNMRALERAAETACALGFRTEIAYDVSDQPIAEGCALLISRVIALRQRAAHDVRPVCLISGGEFSCPVKGAGRGGRNTETVLRGALEIDKRVKVSANTLSRIVLLSAGTDGIDGNSPAAGAICDEKTISRARASGVDAMNYLEASDSYTFFDALGDAIITGPTGTNIRDLRILLMK